MHDWQLSIVHCLLRLSSRRLNPRPSAAEPIFEAFQTYVRDALNLRPSALPPLPEMCTMCTVYSFSLEGVGQQDVYNVYSVQFST